LATKSELNQSIYLGIVERWPFYVAQGSWWPPSCGSHLESLNGGFVVWPNDARVVPLSPFPFESNGHWMRAKVLIVSIVKDF
jgi:hypothetical protein